MCESWLKEWRKIHKHLPNVAEQARKRIAEYRARTHKQAYGILEGDTWTDGIWDCDPCDPCGDCHDDCGDCATVPNRDAVPPTKPRCTTHTWVDTGTHKSFCKVCDVSAVWDADAMCWKEMSDD